MRNTETGLFPTLIDRRCSSLKKATPSHWNSRIC